MCRKRFSMSTKFYIGQKPAKISCMPFVVYFGMNLNQSTLVYAAIIKLLVKQYNANAKILD